MLNLFSAKAGTDSEPESQVRVRILIAQVYDLDKGGLNN
jgi:hypothetical protein